MEQAINDNRAAAFSLDTETRASSPGYQAYQILHLGFVVAPVEDFRLSRRGAALN
jgi:hypothetical protein